MAADAAREIYEKAKARVTEAGSAIATAEQLRLMTIDDLQKETDAAAKETLSAEIKEYEATIETQKLVKAAAEKEVKRLKEAKDNSEKLAGIADQIATAKENTDAVVEQLQDAFEQIQTSIQERKMTMFEMDDQIETFRYQAD